MAEFLRPDKNQISLIADSAVIQDISKFLYENGKVKWFNQMQYHLPPGVLLSWQLELPEEHLVQEQDLARNNNLAQPSVLKIEQSQEVQQLQQQVEQLQQQITMLLPSDSSPEPTPNDNNQEPLDNSESEISQPVAAEEAQLDRDSDI